jgi:hypothetical protein
MSNPEGSSAEMQHSQRTSFNMGEYYLIATAKSWV